MKAEGHCPSCGATLGVRLADDNLPLPKRSVKRLIDKDGNGMYCQACEEYYDPAEIEVKG